MSIQAYILFSKHEQHRRESLSLIKKELCKLNVVEPVFAAYEKIPFLSSLIKKSKQRTGKALSAAEVAVLLSHRKIWQEIKKLTVNSDTHFLILESDSKLNDAVRLKDNFDRYTKPFDIFFWGGWDGYMRVKKSSIIFNQQGFTVGEPLIKSVYCAYGYSLNKKAAIYLLNATSTISYPVDMYKKFILPGDLNIGAVRPEIIAAWYNTPSSIQKQNWAERIKRFCIVQIFDFRNRIQAYFS